MGDFRKLIDSKPGRGCTMEVYQVTRNVVSYVGKQTQIGRQLRVRLEGGSALLEPGAFQYSNGRITADVQKNDPNAGFFKRAIAQAGTGESAFSTRFSGYGDVWTELTSKEFIIAQMDGPQDALLLDDKAFYACEGSIQLKTHVHNTISGMFSGNGLMQPKLEGSGVFVVESPVPVDEIEEIEMDGSGEHVVDGDLMLMYSATLSVELRPLVAGIRNAMRSGEGLVYVLRGRGHVWLMPTHQKTTGMA
jgi:uncharacterized protein (AIM24 family)